MVNLVLIEKRLNTRVLIKKHFYISITTKASLSEENS